MDLVYELRARGGFARTSSLIELGYTYRAIRAALASGRVLRPRNGWLVDSSIDPALWFAAHHGVLLSCVTEARRLGLWVTEQPQRPHVAVRSRGDHPQAPAVLHWGRPMVSRPPEALTDPLPNTLEQVARCLPFEHAVATWESALNKTMIDLPTLHALPLGPEAKRVLASCTPFSDSGLETLFKTRLRWLEVPIRHQVWLHGHRVDFLIGQRLVVQVDGKQHVGQQKVSDYRHDFELELRGFHVIRVSYYQVMHDWPAVQESIMLAIAAGWHLAA